MTPEELINEIEACFVNLTPPRLCGGEWFRSNSFSSDFDKEDANALSNPSWATWRDIPKQLIGYHQFAFWSASPEAFFFLLPAYMVWTIENTITGGNVLPPSALDVISALHPFKSDGKLNKRKLEQYQMLGTHQIMAVRMFLDYAAKLEYERIPQDIINESKDFWDKARRIAEQGAALDGDSAALHPRQ